MSIQLNIMTYFELVDFRLSSLKILTANPTVKKPLGRSRYSWEDNIRTDLKK